MVIVNREAIFKRLNRPSPTHRFMRRGPKLANDSVAQQPELFFSQPVWLQSKLH